MLNLVCFVCRAIEGLCFWHDSVGALLRAGVLPLLVNFLQVPPSPGVLELTVSTLMHMSFSRKKVSLYLMRNHALPKLVKHLMSHNLYTVAHTAAVLKNIAFRDVTAKRAVALAKGIYSLVRLLTDVDRKHKQGAELDAAVSAIECLGCLMHRCFSNKIAACRHGAVRTLRQLLEAPEPQVH